jgi:hypothetical protein
LAKYECGFVNPGKNLWLLCPPDKDIIEGHAARDDDERHGDAEPFVRQCEREDQDEQEESQEEDWNDERKAEGEVEVCSSEPEVDLSADGES